jgi:hypothetical protein
MTEQIRTLSAQRFRRPAREIVLTADDLTEVQRLLAQMLTVQRSCSERSGDHRACGGLARTVPCSVLTSAWRVPGEQEHEGEGGHERYQAEP